MTKPSPQGQESDWQAKADEYLAGWQRTRADFENFRKRAEAERKTLLDLARAQALLKITPILDDFRRAFAHLPQEHREASWVDGIRQIERHVRQILADGGLEPIEALGRFDPQLHEAIAYDDHPELPDGQVIEVIEVGWRVNNQVLKPAKVRVSKGAKMSE